MAGGTFRESVHFTSTEWSWALYDVANSAFTTSVMAGFFPIFFKSFLAADLSARESTLWLGVSSSIIMVVTLTLLPWATVTADRTGSGVRKLFVGTGVGLVATALLALPRKGAWLEGACIYGTATAALSVALVFYDSLLPRLATAQRAQMVSALGYSLGYLGGGALLLAQVILLQLGPSWGVTPTVAVQLSFLSVALWWGVFSIPLWRARHALSSIPSAPSESTLSILRQLTECWSFLWRDRHSRYFLIAFFLFMDGVQTIMKMAVDFGLSLGLQSTDLISALLLTQFVGFPSALLFGKLAGWLGPLRTITVGLVIYLVVTVWAGVLSSAWEFYLLAGLIGIAQGGVQAVSRAHLSDMVDLRSAAQSFLLFSVLSKASAILGPALMGITGYLAHSPRVGIAPIGIMFAIAIFFLSICNQPKLSTAK